MLSIKVWSLKTQTKADWPKNCVICSMPKEYIPSEKNSSQLNDDGPDTPWTWEPQEIAQLEDALQKTHTERFRIMAKLMRRAIMLKNAKITRPKV